MHRESARMCLFIEAINITTKLPLCLHLLLPRINNMTALRHLPQFLKLELFVNAGLGLVLKCLKYDGSAFEGNQCVHGFVSW